MTSEKDYIISKWKEHFDGLRNRKLAIYGVGKNTKTILEEFATDNIIGLMDEVRAGENLYGKPIITMADALAAGVEVVVIVARASNSKIIYRRIASACTANSIDVYEINGRKVDYSCNVEKSYEKYIGTNEQVLKKKIGKADIVSFDIFDTLIMRRVLYPRDIFALAGRNINAGFEKQRIDAEMELYREGRHPNIYDIYERMDHGSPDVELELESEYLIRRESMVEMLRFAHEAGKAIYLVSDMYLTAEIIHKLLYDLDIHVNSNKIFVSCDYNVSKSSGLFNVLRVACRAA